MRSKDADCSDWIYKRAMKKIIINGQMRNKPFLIVIYHSSLVKAAMNAARVCKMRNGVSKTQSMWSLFYGECVNKNSEVRVTFCYTHVTILPLSFW